MQYLGTASSAEAQRSYENGLRRANAPGCVPTEVICQWGDWFTPENSDWFCAPEFSEEEQSALRRFNCVWDEVADETSDPLPANIDDLIETSTWQRLMDAAAEALSIFEIRGQLVDRAKMDED